MLTSVQMLTVKYDADFCAVVEQSFEAYLFKDLVYVARGRFINDLLF